MTISIKQTSLALLGLGMCVMAGCKENPPPSLYQETPVTGPTLTAVSPNDSALAGVSIVTITGSGFSPVREYNFVNFGSRRATVLEATTAQLKVTAPIFVSDSTPVKVAVQGQELFSNAIAYKLKAAVAEFGVLANTIEEPFGITCDSAGNAYVSLLTGGGTGLGVKKITPAGVRSDYSPVFSSSVNKWTSMKFGPGGFLYTAANRNAIFRIPAGGGNSAPWASVAAANVTFVYDFDFDQQGNIWGGGDNTNIVRVAQDRSVKGFPFAGDVRGVRYFQNYLYLATKNDSVWNIWRTRIVSADSISTPELYVNFTSKFGSVAGAYALTFAADGDMFIGTDSVAGSLAVIHPDKSAERFYPGLFSGKIQSLAYGKTVEMYLSRTGSTDALKKILRVNTQKQGAPYYGRQ